MIESSGHIFHAPALSTVRAQFGSSAPFVTGTVFLHPYILSTGKGSSILVSGQHSHIKLEWTFVICGFVFIFHHSSIL